MALGSSEETVAILYDNENSPYEMLDYALKKAKYFLPCRMIVVSDWESCPEQKRWQKLMLRPGFTFRQIERTREGENSLDYALADTAMMMCREGVARFVFITNDADFADIAKALKKHNEGVLVWGVGNEHASHTLRDACDKFICYKGLHGNTENDIEEQEMNNFENEELKLNTNVPQQEEVVLTKGAVQRNNRVTRRKTTVSSGRVNKRNNNTNNIVKGRIAARQYNNRQTPVQRTQQTVIPVATAGVPEVNGELTVHIPKTLHQQLVDRTAQENVDINQLVTFLLMQGINK